MRITLKERGSVVAESCEAAVAFGARLVGLIGRKSFQPGEGLYFPNCASVHMWFMSIPIDVVFLRRVDGATWEVTSARSDLRPWRFLPVADSRADDALELPSGSIVRLGLKTGALLCSS